MRRPGEVSFDLWVEVLEERGLPLAGPERARLLSGAEEVLDALALSVPPVEPPRALRDRVLGSLDPERHLESMADRLATFFDLGDEPTRDILAQLPHVGREPWEPMEPGIALYHLQGGPHVVDAHCGVISAQPGVSFPAHRHDGDEWVFNLQGRAETDTGRLLLPGDLIHNTPGRTHSFSVVGDEPYVFAAILFGSYP